MADINDRMRKFRRNALLGGLTAAGILGWLLWSDWTELGETQVKIGETQESLDKCEVEIREIPKTEERVLLLREGVKEYTKILPDDKEVNAFVQQLTLFEAEAGVRVVNLDDQDAKTRSGRVKPGAPEAFDRVAYKLQLECETEPLLRFMQMFESYKRFVRISSFKVARQEVLAVVGQEPKIAPHKVDIELETYVYNSKAKAQNSPVIPGDTKKLDMLHAAGVVRADADRDLQLASYTRTQHNNRRDPFSDPRRAAAARDAANASGLATAEASLNNFTARLNTLRTAAADEVKISNTVRRVQAHEKLAEEIATFARDVAAERDKASFDPPKLKARLKAEIEDPLKALEESHAAVAQTAAAALRHAGEQLALMKSALDGGRFDEVVSLHDDLRKLATGLVSDDEIDALLKAADALGTHARNQLDFDARSLTFGGSICFPDTPAKSAVIINGHSFSPGESVDDEVVVETINPAEVSFIFRGEKLVRRTKATAAANPTTPGAKKKKP